MKKIVFTIIFLFLSIIGLGKEIEAKKYNRIASLTLSGDEMILALVNHDRIVGLSGKINKNPGVSHIVEEAKKFPVIESNIETMIELEPDLVIAADWIRKEAIQHIEDSGANIYTYKTPSSFEEQKALIRKLAAIVKEEEQGEILVKDMEDRLTALQKRIADEYKGEKLRIMMYTTYETTSGTGTTFNDMINLIGGINAAAEVGIKGSEKISKEKVIEINPDVIIFPIWTDNEDFDKLAAFVVNDPSFETIKAAKDKKIIPVKYKTTSPTSQYMIDGIEELGKAIYNLKEE